MATSPSIRPTVVSHVHVAATKHSAASPGLGARHRRHGTYSSDTHKMRKHKYTVFQEIGTLFMFSSKMKKNNKLNFDNCCTKNPEDIGHKELM